MYLFISSTFISIKEVTVGFSDSSEVYKSKVALSSYELKPNCSVPFKGIIKLGLSLLNLSESSITSI